MRLIAQTNVAAVWVKIAQCQRNLDQLQEAVESYQAGMLYASKPMTLSSI